MKLLQTITLLTIFLLNCNHAPAQVLQQDSLALVAFYNSTGGPNWYNNSNWLTGPVGTWYGVTVEGERVKELKFYSDNNINGFIPEEIGSLDEVETFVIGNNPNLKGNLPKTIGQLVDLKWFGIGNLINLIQLNLPENNLTGPIPTEIGNLDSLIFLDLNDNQLTGPIPPELGNCNNLKELQLNNNNLTGGLPSELASINGLNGFNVSDNDLSGPIPDEFSYQISYYFFYVNNNNFDYLPPFNNWYLLSGLRVDNNKLTFDHLESHAQAGYMWFDYSPQDDMLEDIDTVLIPGSSYSIYSGTGGEFTNYKWFKNGEVILESSDADTLHLIDISYADTGTYTCQAENSLLNLLNLLRRQVHITLDTGTNILHYHLQNHISVYPNPASDNITITLPAEPAKLSVKIYNPNGKCIFTERHENAYNLIFNIDITDLKQGLFLVQVQTEKSNYSTKLIINNRGIIR